MPLTWVLVAIVAVFILWLISMPCFPTTDSPVHMYYVHVLGSLLAHNNPAYEHFFRIRHLLPPYSLYYYALLLLSKAMPMLVADRVIIGVYFLSFIFGFRFLARGIGPSADLATLLVTPLLLNWPLGMGFVNFCLSLSFTFWATGLWLRLQGTRNLWGRTGFLLLVTGIMLTHPVPLLLLLVVTGALLLARIVHFHRTDPGLNREGVKRLLPAHGLADLATLALAALNVGYVKLFAQGNPLQQVNETGEAPLPYWVEFGHRLTMYMREHAVAFVYGKHLDTLLYRTALLVILIVPVLLALQQRRRNREKRLWMTGDTFLALSLGIFVGLPFVPSQLNGLYYFADRLVVCVWLAFLLAFSGWSGRWHEGSEQDRAVPLNKSEITPEAARAPELRWVLVCALLAVGADAALLSSANRNLRPAATAIAHLDREPPVLLGQVGFVLDDPRPPLGGNHEGVSWNPYYWALVHTFRHNDAVMANAPWMHESIIPVAPSAALPEVSIAALQEPFGTKLQRDLLRSPADLHQALAADTFFLVDQQDRPALEGGEPLLGQGDAEARQWTCSKNGWYRLCRQAPGLAQMRQSLTETGRPPSAASLQ